MMLVLVYLYVACLVVVVTGSPADLLEDTELVLTFLVHRHGDRTPYETTLNYSEARDELVELSKPYGYGQLTNNQAYANCPTFIENYKKLQVAPSKSMTNTSRKIYVLSILSKHSGVDLLQSPGLAYSVYNLFISQISLGLPVDPEIQAIWPEVESIAGEAAEVGYGDKNFIALLAGVLLNEFYKAACDIISGNNFTRVRIYSAHDFNVFSLMSATKIVNKQGVPKFCSAYALELRRVVKTGKYVVVPVYLPSPGEDFIHLEVEGCGTVCDYQEFVDITSEYALDEDTWRTKCGWTKDMFISNSAF